MQTKGAKDQAANWYLITNRDGLAVKILHAITVGEHNGGTLVIDSHLPEERWATLSFDANGHLLISEQHQFYHLAGPGALSTDKASYYVPRGTVLQMPNNEIYISGDFRRGHAEHEISLTRMDLPSRPPVRQQYKLSNTPESISDLLRPTRSPLRAVTKKPLGPVSEIPLLDIVVPVKMAGLSGGKPAASNDVIRGKHPSSSSVAAPKSNPLLKIQANPGRAQTPSSEQTWSWFGTFLTVIAIGVLAVVFVEWNRNKTVMDGPEVIIQSPRISFDAYAPPPRQRNVPPKAVQEASSRDDSIDDDQFFEIVSAYTDKPSASTEITDETMKWLNLQSGETATTPESATVNQPVLDTQALLLEARQLLGEGFIIWPDERNAVLLIQEALQAQPQNASARVMLDEAAEELIEQATSAYNDGFVLGAAKVVEDVLRFHPGYRPALEWAQKPRGRNSENSGSD